MVGRTLSRIVHRIVSIRSRHPNGIILIRKDDFKSAYRRINLNQKIAIKCATQLTIVEEITYLLIYLRLSFGGSPCPPEFCVLADFITDIINDLFSDKYWDPAITKSEFVHKIPEKQLLDLKIKFEEAKKIECGLTR